MNTITLTFVLHNHQPLGNFDWVMEDAYQKAYLPFLEGLERHPGARVGIHNTGILLEWFAEHHPEYLDRLRLLVNSGQVEVLTGTYYEAILPSISDEDKIGQIRKLSGFIETLFGRKPRGMWVAERVWEPGLALPLAEAGVDYVFLDDSHFKLAGLSSEQLTTCFVSEEQGRSIRVMPINQPLRHSIPFDKPTKPIEILKAAAESGSGKWLAFADDGEKLGSWPGTYEWVYGEHWLDRFFDLVQSNPWIEMKLPSQALDAAWPGGRVELPAASYSEMLEWSGGHWLNFLSRYPESNWMHKRMQRLSRSVPAEGKAREEVWKSQCNCPYWHGVFGGLYLTHLRRETYTHIIQAEVEAGLPKAPETRCEDVDLDGRDEIIQRSSSQSFYFKPGEGGALVEWDLFAKSINLINTLARRTEAYHAKLQEKLQAQTAIPYDWYLRRSFVDHFLQDGATLEGFAACSYGEQGDFVLGEYQAQTDPLRLEREGGVWIGNRHCRVKVSKRFELQDSGVRAFYEITNQEDHTVELWFGVEFNVSLSAGEGKGRYYRLPDTGRRGAPLNATASHFDQRSIELVDEWLGLGVALNISEPSCIWTCPVETLSQSESGADRIYQSSVLVPNWRIRLGPGRSWSVTLQNTARPL